jgi:pimeloyl-ACP methyl ester carboxylesterase
MGGYVALAFARMAPERVRGLVLVGARADADSPERRDARMQTIGQIQERGAEGAVLAMSAVLESEPAAATKLAIAREQQPEALVNAQRAMRDRPDLTDVVKALQAPQLVVVGESDPLFPPDEAKALAAAAANGRAAVIEGAGHLPSLEQPDAFNDELLGFVASLE